MVKMVSALGWALAAAMLATPAGAALTLGEATGSKLGAALTTSAQQQQSEPAASQTSGSNRITQQVGWSAPNSFTLSYDAASDVLSAVVNGGPAVVRSSFLAGATTLKEVSIGVRDPAIAGLVALSDLQLNGADAHVSLNGFDADGYRYWTITGGEFAQGFTLSGTLALDQTFATQSAGMSALEFVIGGAAVPEPAQWTLMIGGFGLIGWALRRQRAGRAVSA